MSGLDFARDGADWPLRETSRFVDTAHFHWHVQEMGEGAPCLLIHGSGGATHSWRDFAPILAGDFRVLAPDLPGHAFTRSRRRPDLSLNGMADAVDELLAALNFRPRLVIGHSAGAVILARLIAQGRLQPDLYVAINGAFLPFKGFGGVVFPFLAKALVMNPFAPRIFAWTADKPTVAKLLAGMGSKIDAFGLDLYTRLLSNSRHAGGALAMMANWDLSRTPDDLARMPCPALLILGANDHGVPPEGAMRLAKAMSRVVVERVANVGHLAHEEKPEAIAAIVRRAAEEVGLVRPSASLGDNQTP